MNNKKMRFYDQTNYESLDNYFHENSDEPKFYPNSVTPISSRSGSNLATSYAAERFMAIPEFNHQFRSIPTFGKCPPKPIEADSNGISYPNFCDNFMRSYERDALESVPNNSLHGNGSSINMFSSEDARMVFQQGFRQPYVSLFIIFYVSLLRRNTFFLLLSFILKNEKSSAL